jgi:hypothetical protein
MPLVVGTGAPSIARIASDPLAPDLYDLRDYGHQRDAVCRAIEERAKRRAEQRFFTTRMTVEGVSTLLLCQSLEDMHDTEGLRGGARMYSAAAIEAVRRIRGGPCRS